jgi:hypothetical protein
VKRSAFDTVNLIIAPLGARFVRTDYVIAQALINIPFIDASGIVIKLREIFMVDNGADTVSSTVGGQKFVPQICPYVRFRTILTTLLAEWSAL